MIAILFALFIYLIYLLIGFGFMAWIDMPERYNGALFEWVKTCPMRGLIMLAWPWMFWKAYSDMRRESP